MIIERKRLDQFMGVNMNKIILNNDYAEVVINSKKHGAKKTLISVDDLEKIKNITWYPYWDKKVKNYMHMVGTTYKKRLLNCIDLLQIAQKEMVVDHINHDTLDNRN